MVVIDYIYPRDSDAINHTLHHPTREELANPIVVIRPIYTKDLFWGTAIYLSINLSMCLVRKYRWFATDMTATTDFGWGDAGG